MVRRAASNMRKDLTCTKVLEIIMQPDPSSELQYVLSQITDYNCCKGSVENLHQVCAITHLFLHASYSQSQSPAAVPPDTNPQTAAGTSSSGVKRGTCKWCRGQKKEHSALASVVVDTLAKSTKWYAASPAGKTEHTHTHPHTHHTQTHTKYLE